MQGIKRRHRSDKEFKIAIEKSDGFYNQIAEMLNLSRRCVEMRIEKNEELQIMLDQKREGTIDYVESALLRLIQEGNPAAIIFFLKTRGRHRGYTEVKELDNGNHKLIVEHVYESLEGR